MQRSWGWRVWPKSRSEYRREESAEQGAGEEKGEVGGGTWAETSTDGCPPGGSHSAKALAAALMMLEGAGDTCNSQ